ncbi:peptidoglycan DD-metalloendopeptidase family protein [Candidatus Uhrbacteria bacterium]|nr:peptidoglycan DD-metalloendopeptidase family protein [Candidatus Uhrbacteria bacterium]
MKLRRFIAGLNILALLVPSLAIAQEEGSIKQEIDALNSQVKQKEQRINEINGVIGKYRKRIEEQDAAQSSLQNQVALLENRILEKELAIERTRSQIDLATLELQRLKVQITAEEQRLQRRRDSLAGVIAEMQDAQSVGLLESFVARQSLSEFFTRMDELSRVEGDLTNATEAVRELKAGLESKQKETEQYRASLQSQQTELQKEQEQLENDQGAKLSLLTETQEQETEFQRMLFELRQQKQEEANDAARLEDQLKDKLDSIDKALARGDILLNWPIKATRGISARFHDPGYPFRKLFEHPGTDIPTSVNTPVRAAAGGYVAFNRTGKQYGNYIMVIHPGGISTVYAHLKSFVAKADTYVERGDVIGYSGGRPGDQGAGLSTGPHLHFEVRQNGIPVDAEQFLPDID